MKILTLIRITCMLLFYSIFSSTHCQISGTINVPGDYPNILSVISAINNNGVGIPGLTVNIAANFTETLPYYNSGWITTSGGSESAPILFQKTGIGDNPLITSPQGIGSLDAVIMLVGCDYVTFDGIDLLDPSSNTSNYSSMEWGFALVKQDNFNGCQHISIKNCHISLHKSNPNSVGIYAGNHTPYNIDNLNPTSPEGCNSHLRIYNNVVDNAYQGIALKGVTNSSTIGDIDNQIGTEGGNVLTEFGGGNVECWAIYCTYQNDLDVSNNNINGGTGCSDTLAGIYLKESNRGNLVVSNNTIELQSSCLSSGIFSKSYIETSNQNILIINNIIHNCTIGGRLFSIWIDGYVQNETLMNNQVTNNNCLSFSGVESWPWGSNINSHHGQICYNTVENNICSGTDIQFIGISAIGEGVTDIFGNQVINLTASNAQGYLNGMYLISPSQTATILVHSNTIQGLSINGPLSCYSYGIYYSDHYAANTSFYDNVISDISVSTPASSTIMGITVQGIGFYNSFVNLYRNSIYNLFANGSGSNTMAVRSYTVKHLTLYDNDFYGLYSTGSGAYARGFSAISQGCECYLYNNFISDLRTPTSNMALGIVGLEISGNARVFNNTVLIQNSQNGGGSFSSAGIWSGTYYLTDFRNNIVVNTSLPGVNGRTVAYQRQGADTLQSVFTSTGNNCYYAGTPGPKNLIFYDGTSSIPYLADFKVFANPHEQNSISELPPFLNSTTAPYNLHLNCYLSSLCESGGTVITSPLVINNDIDNQARFPYPGYPYNPGFPATAPDIGADEFAGNQQDTLGPVFYFFPLANTPSLVERTFSAKIEDVSGIPVATSGLPRLYWNINHGSWNYDEGNLLGDTVFTFNLGSGVSLYDTVFYYLVAQDAALPGSNVSVTPEIGAFGLTSNPPACLIPPQSPLYYIVRPGIEGFVKYSNSSNTALTGINVYLTDSLTGLTDSTQTDSNGRYSFGSPAPAQYTITYKSELPGSGFNSVDALLVLKHFVNIINLQDISARAADVDGNGIINAVDALLIVKRFAGITSTFPNGDWAFPLIHINYSGIPQFINIDVRCYGDVDGSYLSFP